jgi:hypothetical protein
VFKISSKLPLKFIQSGERRITGTQVKHLIKAHGMCLVNKHLTSKQHRRNLQLIFLQSFYLVNLEMAVGQQHT